MKVTKSRITKNIAYHQMLLKTKKAKNHKKSQKVTRMTQTLGVELQKICFNFFLASSALATSSLIPKYCKIDLSIGMLHICKKNLMIVDYGLERLIFVCNGICLSLYSW